MNSGVAILNKKIFNFISLLKNEFISLENHIYPILSKEKKLMVKSITSKQINLLILAHQEILKKLKASFKKL